jgi:hypothetical protein
LAIGGITGERDSGAGTEISTGFVDAAIATGRAEVGIEGMAVGEGTVWEEAFSIGVAGLSDGKVREKAV